MKTNLLKGVFLGTFVSISVIASAQILSENVKQMSFSSKAKALQTKVVKSTKFNNLVMDNGRIHKAAADLEAGYYYPSTLSPFYYAIDDQGYFTTFAHYAAANNVNNIVASEADPLDFDYQFLPLGVDEDGNGAVPVIYYDASTGNPTEYHWTAQTGEPTPAEAESADGNFYYGSAEGRFPYPTQTVTSAAGTADYTAPGRLKVGQKTEVSLSNWFQFTNEEGKGTWGLGAFTFKDNKGNFPGSNSLGLEGYGNVFVFPTPVVLTGVNVYIYADATAADPNNEVELNVYKPDMDKGILDSELVATAKLKVSEMNGNGYDEIGIYGTDKQGQKVNIVNIAKFKFDHDVTLEDQIYLITVEKIGNDLAGGDNLTITLDPFNLKPETGDENYIFAHHSFVKAESTTGDMAYFTANEVIGMTGLSFHIDPIIYSVGSETSIASNPVKENKATATVDENGNIVASVENAKYVNVYNAMGAIVYSSFIEDTAVIPATGWVHGLYIIKFDNGAMVKVVR